MPTLTIHGAGPGLTVQDLGRPGWKAQGLSSGGAVDRLALFEAAALLGTSPGQAVIEMMGFGGTFHANADTRIALTGAEMQADIDGTPIAPNRTHLLTAGAMLNIGSARAGLFGYLAFAGGIMTAQIMDSRATHLTAGIGKRLEAGEALPFGADPDRSRPAMRIAPETRFTGGAIRIMPGPQTDFFTPETLHSFTQPQFSRSPRGNRQGIKLDYDGNGFPADGGRNIVSDLIVPGEIQMAGDGVPYILLAECQTIGGYPRIGSVIPADLPKIAQAAPGTPLQFGFLTIAEADATALSDQVLLSQLTKMCQTIVRDPNDIADLLGYQLISGATRGDDLERS